MERKSLKVVIAADNALVVNGLRHNLENNFGESLQITSCYDARVLLRSIDDKTDITVIDYFFDGISADQLKRKIKALNHETSVIMHSSHEDVITALKRHLQGAKEKVANGGQTVARRAGLSEEKYTYRLERQYL